MPEHHVNISSYLLSSTYPDIFGERCEKFSLAYTQSSNQDQVWVFLTGNKTT